MKLTKAKLVLFTYRKLQNGQYPIYLRLTKERKNKYVSTGYTCEEKDWNIKKQELKSSYQEFREANLFLKQVLIKANNAILQCEREEKQYTLEVLIKKLSKADSSDSVVDYIDSLIARFEKAGKVGNSRVYKDLKRSLVKFAGLKITFQKITNTFLKDFQADFQSREVKGSSISIYFRTLRSVFNKAIHEGIINQKLYPFDNFKLSGVRSEVEKRKALTSKELLAILNSEPKIESMEYHAKNYFLFSFYAVGINFIDLANLSTENIQGERLIYVRSKTQKKFSIKLELPAIKIIECYQGQTTKNFLFPILKSNHATAQSRKERITSLNITINKALRRLAMQAGISDVKGLTYYSARHTWATLQKKRGTKTSLISESLGHATEEVTQTYLESFENEVLDQTNADLINSF